MGQRDTRVVGVRVNQYGVRKSAKEPLGSEARKGEGRR